LMEDKIKRISDLVVKHLGEELSQDEYKELLQWIDASGESRQKFLDNRQWIEKFSAYGTDAEKMEANWKKIMENLGLPEQTPVVPFKRYWIRYAAAVAAVLLVATSVTLFWPKPLPKQKTSNTSLVVKDIAPGGNKAVLTLSDGTTIILDSAKNGQLALQGTTAISKQDGLITYKTGEKHSKSEIQYNTISTPSTGIYKVVLADGSTVFLNSVSTLRYPTAFTGNIRDVSITGEGFFEVTKDASKPFRVSILSADGEKVSEVEVRGTHFNIMAYADEESVKTTLVEGTVIVRKDNKQAQLIPGQQAVLAKNSEYNITVEKDVNVNKTIAWVNSDFYFALDDIQTIMKQLTRWYGVQVEYEGKIPEGTFSGMISRQKKLSEVLKILEISQVRFKLENNKITVLE
jgi:transmembrane sensor